jgi:hypothetical protein
MKKVITGIVILMLCHTVFSQQQTPAPTLTKQDYLQKSKSQKTTAWILLGGGAALVVAGSALFADDFNLYEADSGTGGGVMMVAGAVAVGASVPFFIASARNKGRASAMAAGIKLEQNNMIGQNGLVFRNYPAVTLKIGF